MCVAHKLRAASDGVTSMGNISFFFFFIFIYPVLIEVIQKWVDFLDKEVLKYKPEPGIHTVRINIIDLI